MNKKILGFTLIELIIVIVIIGILAVVAIPKYFANIKKAKKAAVVTTLAGIREAMLMYYSANNSFPTITAGTPLAVTVDGDVVITSNVPANYSYDNATKLIKSDTTTIGDGCQLSMNVESGVIATAAGTCP